MITYESALSSCYPAKGNPPLRQEEQHYITEMEREGSRVILEAQGDQHIVKVRRDGQRQIRKASTSGYPVRAAFEAWKERQQ